MNCTCFYGHHQMLLWEVSSSKQVGTGLQYWSPDVSSRGCPRSNVWGSQTWCPAAGPVQWDSRHHGQWLHGDPCEETDACENITFPQLRWQAAMKLWRKSGATSRNDTEQCRIQDFLEGGARPRRPGAHPIFGIFFKNLHGNGKMDYIR